MTTIKPWTCLVETFAFLAVFLAFPFGRVEVLEGLADFEVFEKLDTVVVELELEVKANDAEEKIDEDDEAENELDSEVAYEFEQTLQVTPKTRLCLKS